MGSLLLCSFSAIRSASIERLAPWSMAACKWTRCASICRSMCIDVIARWCHTLCAPSTHAAKTVRIRNIQGTLYANKYMFLCSVHGHLKSANLESYKVLPQGCSPYAAMLYSCVNAETFLNCPAKLWKSDEKCLVAKEFAQQCNPLPHVPLPMSWATWKYFVIWLYKNIKFSKLSKHFCY